MNGEDAVKLWVCAVAVLAAVVPARGQAQRPLTAPPTSQNIGEWFRDPRREAAAVLQGNALPDAATAIQLDSALIDEVSNALRHIRDQIADLRHAITSRHPTALSIKLRPDLGRRVRALAVGRRDRRIGDLWDLPTRAGVPVTGIRALDSLNRRFGVVEARLRILADETDRHPWFDVLLEFRHYVNVPNLISAYKRLPGAEWVRERGHWDLSYVTTHLGADDAHGHVWRFSFREGRGDCPAGCTWAVRSVVRYDRETGKAVLVARDTLGAPH